MFISALFSLIIGTLVLLYILKCFYRAWFSKNSNTPSGPIVSINKIFGFGVTKLIAKKEENLNLAKVSFHNNELKKSKKNLLQSFYFNKYSFFVTPKTLHSQHLRILEALLEFKQSSNIENLEIIEAKIDELTRIHNLYLSETQNKAKFKKSPNWAVKEYNNKVKNLKSELISLESEITKEVDKFYSNLKSETKTNVTYH